MYSQATGKEGQAQDQGQPGSQPGGEQPGAGADPNVENADFEVVDDKDKGEEKK